MSNRVYVMALVGPGETAATGFSSALFEQGYDVTTAAAHSFSVDMHNSALSSLSDCRDAIILLSNAGVRAVNTPRSSVARQVRFALQSHINVLVVTSDELVWPALMSPDVAALSRRPLITVTPRTFTAGVDRVCSLLRSQPVRRMKAGVRPSIRKLAVASAGVAAMLFAYVAVPSYPLPPTHGEWNIPSSVAEQETVPASGIRDRGIVATPAPPPAQIESRESQIERVEELLDEGMTGEAERLFHKLRQERPEDPRLDELAPEFVAPDAPPL